MTRFLPFNRKVIDHNEVTLHYLSVVAEYAEKMTNIRAKAALPKPAAAKASLGIQKERIKLFLQEQRFVYACCFLAFPFFCVIEKNRSNAVCAFICYSPLFLIIVLPRKVRQSKKLNHT